MRHWKRQMGTRVNWRFRTAVILLIALILLVLLDGKIRPIIRTSAAFQANIYAAQLMNEAVSKELEHVPESSIVTLIRDENENITSVSLNVLQVNAIKTGISRRILDELNSIDNQIVEVPLGTLLGSELFSGRGPMIPIRLSPMGVADVQIKNKIEQAGINQVLHEVILTVEVKVSAILPGYSSNAVTKSDFLIAQTVIVGDVPKWFTQYGKSNFAADSNAKL